MPTGALVEAVDGVVIAVHNLDDALGTFARILGGERGETWSSDVLEARSAVVHVGASRIQLAEPTGSDGPVAEHLERWGEGLLAAVVSSGSLEGLAAHLGSLDFPHRMEDAVLHLEPEQTYGLRTLFVPHADRERTGVLSFIYEVTHLVEGWREVTDMWARVFSLDKERFSDISSERYGYEGTLTLFDPPRRLDRIEVVHPHDTSKAMGRFFGKRGPGPYMFYAESADMAGLKRRLDEAGARYAPSDPSDDPEGLFVHPSSAHGVLFGASAPNVAWRWSGRPELATG